MILRGIEFGPVHAASGAMGFFGEGYWFHRLGRPFGLDFNRVTLVAKTTTLEANPGNMRLNADFTPAELFPDCIKVNMRTGSTLNAIALSGPGARALFDTRRWQGHKRPFFLSFMSVKGARDERMAELNAFIWMLKAELVRFRSRIGLQINFSCPNTGHALAELADEVGEALDMAAFLGIPLVPKFNVNFSPAQAAELGRHQACDAICISNTLPWADLPGDVRLAEFGSLESPLAHLKGGGYSGPYLYRRVLDWIVDARSAGYAKPFVAGGGIREPWQAVQLRALAGANSAIFLGSIAMTRGWRLRAAAREASHL
jgi:dihydroorotate dehydrogenase